MTDITELKEQLEKITLRIDYLMASGMGFTRTTGLNIIGQPLKVMGQIEITEPTLAPLVVASNVVVANLNATYFQGYSPGNFATAGHTHTGIYEPANANIQSHISSTTNPHSTTAAQVGADITTAGVHAATSKATPVDTDETPLLDSAASFGLKKLTWANIKATLLTYFNGIYSALGHTHAGSNPWTTLIKTADQSVTNNNTILIQATGITFTTVANTNYHIRLRIFAYSEATCDFKSRLLHGGTTTRVQRNITKGVAGGAAAEMGPLVAFDTSDIASLSGTGYFTYYEDIILKVGASGGVFEFKFAQYTLHATQIASVLQGSYLEYAIS